MDFFRRLLILFLLLNSGIAFANLFPRLSDSDFAKRHPEALPYSQCQLSTVPTTALGMFSNEKGSPSGSKSIGLIAGFDFYSKKKIFLNCVSDKFRVAYSVPIRRGRMFSVGQFGASIGAPAVPEFDLDTVNHKKVSDLFGVFGGFRAKGDFLAVSGSSGTLENSSGVQLQLGGWGPEVGLSANLGYSRLRISPYQQKQIDKLLVQHGNNSYILTTSVPQENPQFYIFKDENGDNCLRTRRGDIKMYSIIGLRPEQIQKFLLPDGGRLMNVFHLGAIVFRKENGSLVYQTTEESLNLALDYHKLENYTFVSDDEFPTEK